VCVLIEFVEKDDHGRLVAVGGRNNPEGWNFFGRTDWGEWVESVSGVVALIESGTWSFFAKSPGRGRTRVEVVVASRGGRKYIKTIRDGVEPNNLLALPSRPATPPASYTIPGLPVALPPARMPGQPKVYSRGQEVKPNQNGLFDVLPATGFRLVVTSPWPAELEVSANGLILTRDYSGATKRPDLEASGMGWYYPTLRALDRDATVWDLTIYLPPSMRYENLVSLNVSSVSMNPLCNEYMSPPLALPIASHSLASQPPRPRGAKSGTERVYLVLDETPGPNYPFLWNGFGLEDGAVVTSVKNISLTVGTGDFFERKKNIITLAVTHDGITTVQIPPQAVTHKFDGTQVKGLWAAKAENVYGFYLITPSEAGATVDRAICALEVGWTKS
jgi:hypothetical protein